MESELLLCQLEHAIAERDVSALSDLSHSKYPRITTQSTLELYCLEAVSLDALLLALSRFKDDDSLRRIVHFMIQKGRIDDLFKVLNPDYWEDYIVLLEQLCMVLRKGQLSRVQTIHLFKADSAALDNCEQSRRSIAVYLLGYCEFRINRYPERQVDIAEHTAHLRPFIPYPEEHGELLHFLAAKGHAIDKLGYDPDLHGEIAVAIPPEHLIEEAISEQVDLAGVLAVDARNAMLYLLHHNFSINFVTNSYTANKFTTPHH